MYMSSVAMFWVLAFGSISFAATSANMSKTAFNRDAPKPQGHITLPSQTFNTTASAFIYPFGISCYNADFRRTRIAYDTCLPLLNSISHENDYRQPKTHTSINPFRWVETPDCEVQVWRGPVPNTVTDQYIAGMVAWYVFFLLPSSFHAFSQATRAFSCQNLAFCS